MTEQANLFELSGDGGRSLSYSSTSITGAAQLSYEGPEGERSFSADEIETARTELGEEVTVTLRAIPDARTTTLTLLVPPVRIENGESASVETLAIVTTRVTSIAGPPPGQGYRYGIVALRGDARFVVS